MLDFFPDTSILCTSPNSIQIYSTLDDIFIYLIAYIYAYLSSIISFIPRFCLNSFAFLFSFLWRLGLLHWLFLGGNGWDRFVFGWLLSVCKWGCTNIFLRILLSDKSSHCFIRSILRPRSFTIWVGILCGISEILRRIRFILGLSSIVTNWNWFSDDLIFSEKRFSVFSRFFLVALRNHINNKDDHYSSCSDDDDDDKSVVVFRRWGRWWRWWGRRWRWWGRRWRRCGFSIVEFKGEGVWREVIVSLNFDSLISESFFDDKSQIVGNRSLIKMWVLT